MELYRTSVYRPFMVIASDADNRTVVVPLEHAQKERMEILRGYIPNKKKQISKIEEIIQK